MTENKRRSTEPTLSGWGRLSVPGREVRSEDLAALSLNAFLFRGLGRAYGDSALPAPGQTDVATTTLGDRLLDFDPVSGVIRAEAGLSLLDLNRLFMPRGWFTPVSPGTQFVTLGGMVAADIHGKNHHRHGCFGRHVRRLRLRVPDGRVLWCSPAEEPELFWAVIGGMGLLGHILEVEFSMLPIPTPWIWCESERIRDLDEFVVALKEAGPHWPYTVGWIDCISTGSKMGRGILQRGRFAETWEAPPSDPEEKRRVSIPFELPSWALGPLSVRAFNMAYYWKHVRKKQAGLLHPDSFFYPLDAVNDWNLVYGRRGFTQYQCVLPDSAGPGAARRFLTLLTSKGGASFLCVIKDCGAQGSGLLSFPRTGISIALDIAVRDNTRQLVDDLNELVIAEGGRIYLAKDAFTRADHFRRMEPRLSEFLSIREKWDPERRIRSAQSVRIFGD